MTESWALPRIELALCSGCGVCVQRCPTHSVAMIANRPSFVRPADCTYCGECEARCPEGAIKCAYEITWGADSR